jgi:4-hydroxybenzoate polyprenyltransferase
MVHQNLFKNIFLSSFSFVFSYGFNCYLELEQNLLLAFFLSLGTFLVYSFQQQGFKLISSLPFLFILILIAFLFYKLRFNLYTNLISIITVLISIIYVFPAHFSLRKIPFLKLFVIAFCWTTAFILIPMTLVHKPISISLIGIMFLFFMLLSLPFDIHQQAQDRNQIKTIPLAIGSYKTQYVLYLLCFCYFIINYNTSIFSLTNIFFLLSIIQIVIVIVIINQKINATILFFLTDTLLITNGLAFYFEKY